MVKLDAIQKRLIEEIADLHSVPEGAYNFRANSQLAGRNTTANIDIVSKEDGSGIDIHIKPGTKNESVHIPVVLSQSGIKETVYNDFYVGEDSDVVIVAGCGIDNCGSQDSEHDGIHRFYVGKNAKVKYVEKHYGSGDGKGQRILNPVTEVYMEEDDRGNPFPSKLAVIYEDEEQENVVNNVCPHCGKQFHSLVGKYQEFIICMAGSARVGKTAYLASLMAAIEDHGNKYAQHVYGADNPDYRFFSENIMKPYRANKRIPKTAFEGSGETIPLFSAPIRVLDRTYLFTFIDMPGEAFDSDDVSSGAKFIINDRKIVKHAQMIWFCIDPQQIDAEVASMNHVATAQDDKVNENTRQVMENIGQTLSQVCLEGKKNAAILVTKSDLILGKGGFDSLFRPDEHAFRDYVREDGAMDFDHEKEFSQKAFQYLDQAHGIIATISGMFEDYTTFAVAAYGMNVNPIEDDDIRIMMGENLLDAEKNPSMVELPFLWTAAELGLVPATKIVEEWIPPKKIGPITVRPGYAERRLMQVSQKELFVK